MSTGAHGQQVYGGTSSQVAGPNGAIAQNLPMSPSPMMGGRRSRRNNSRRNNSRRNHSRRNQDGNSRRNQDGGRRSRRNNSRRQRQRQRGGK
jgi:hypothetical protein